MSPIPNQRMLSGIHASGGIGRMNSRSGSTARRKPTDQPMPSPSGTPSSAATPTATSTRRRLSTMLTTSEPLASSSRAAENTAVGGGSITSSCGLIAVPKTLASSHTTRNTARSHR